MIRSLHADIDLLRFRMITPPNVMACQLVAKICDSMVVSTENRLELYQRSFMVPEAFFEHISRSRIVSRALHDQSFTFKYVSQPVKNAPGSVGAP